MKSLQNNSKEEGGFMTKGKFLFGFMDANGMPNVIC